MTVVMGDEDYKEVYFKEYCKTCKHEKLPEIEMPCAECLDYPVNLYSHKPINWKAKDGFEDFKVDDPRREE